MTPQIVATRIGDLIPGHRSNGPRRAFGLSGLCLLSVLTVACAEAPDDPPPPAFTVTDSGGVRMVVNSGQAWGEGDGWQVTAEPVVTLGVMDFPVEQQFQNIAGATRLSDGTTVILEQADFGLQAFNVDGDLLWTAGGVGDGPGEMRSYPDTRPVLTKLDGDILQVQNGQDRVRYTPAGDVHEHRKVDYARFRRWGRIFLQYCPFDAYFVQDQIVVCHGMLLEPPYPDSWDGRHTIMRTTWDLDRLDTLGVFLKASFFRAGPAWVGIRSPLAAQGMFRVATTPEPKLLYARNDAYRIEVWDIPAGNLAMVVERRVPRRARTDEEADYLVRSGDLGVVRLIGIEMGFAIDFEAELDKAHSAAIDSVSIAEALFLDELGYIWVRRGPSALDGEHAGMREVTGPDDTRWTIPALSGLHDVFRPDGVYLGAVKLPADLRITEIGPDYVLGIVTDEMDVQYVWMYGLDRGGGGPR